MTNSISALFELVHEHDGIRDKERLAKIVADAFGLTEDRPVFYCKNFAIRFSQAKRQSFSNTVLSLSKLQKFDDRPFIVCLVTPTRNHCFIANTTFLKKISHSSQELRVDNIKGSFNGSDIVGEFEGIANFDENIERLYHIHSGIEFEDNLLRLVEATNSIIPSGSPFFAGQKELKYILDAPSRALKFISSADSKTLKSELDEQVARFKNEILLAALIENVKIRGSVIEYLIAGEDEALQREIARSLHSHDNLPSFRTRNTLGDYERIFKDFDTQTDVKTKIMVLSSNPKAYNLDKMLSFLANDKSVFLFYFVGVEPYALVNTVLVSMFQKDLLESTILLRHWAGRNTRGTSQFEGKAIDKLIQSPDSTIDLEKAASFLRQVIDLN